MLEEERRRGGVRLFSSIFISIIFAPGSARSTCRVEISLSRRKFHPSSGAGDAEDRGIWKNLKLPPESSFDRNDLSNAARDVCTISLTHSRVKQRAAFRWPRLHTRKGFARRGEEKGSSERALRGRGEGKERRVYIPVIECQRALGPARVAAE